MSIFFVRITLFFSLIFFGCLIFELVEGSQNEECVVSGEPSSNMKFTESTIDEDFATISFEEVMYQREFEKRKIIEQYNEGYRDAVNGKSKRWFSSEYYLDGYYVGISKFSVEILGYQHGSSGKHVDSKYKYNKEYLKGFADGHSRWLMTY